MINENALDRVLQNIIARWGVPGMGVGIVEDGKTIYARGFGVQSLETGIPVTPDSFFCVASIAKCFVATLVMQLVEQGKLQLELPLVTYLPDFRLDDQRYGDITLRQMLSHTSGMPDMDEAEYDALMAHPEIDKGAPERYVRALASRSMIAAPGERFAYSNIAYNVLGVLIARVTGQTFEDAMRQRILRPAGMPESTLLPTEVPRDRWAPPHLRVPGMVVNPITPYHRADAPASFLYSTVREMCAWASTSLNRGLHGGQRLLAPAAYDLMWTPVAQRNDPPFRETMGLGWTLGTFEGVRTVGHGGASFGWTCFLALLPEKNSAAIVMSNEESAAHDLALQAALRALLGKEPELGQVSWMIPIAQALQSGGIQAATACYESIKDSPDYSVDPSELIPLAYQLMAGGRLDIAIELLKLNLHVFPERVGLHLFLARLLVQKDNRAGAEAILRQALAIKPDRADVLELLHTLTG
ncbi:MAG: serine hydrolase [Anaerolineae bacterium]|nr:serine hydrolase [Anaerolineae bacterium]